MKGKAMSVAVVGAGLMGTGIAQVFARAGHSVVITDANSDALGLVIPRVERNLKEEGVEPERALCNLSREPSLAAAVAGADIVFEAVPERLELKQDLFLQIAGAAPRHAVLASNTSVIPITRIGEKLEQQARSRLIGTHWWNPAQLIPLVEVVRTVYTSDAVFEQTFSWLEEVGKRPVKVHRDVTGFIGNRLQWALIREAIGLVEDGVCDAETIDSVVKNSFGPRLSVLGPMEQADMLGLGLTRDVARVIYPELRCDKIPPRRLDALIDDGHVGIKAGRGFMAWTEEEAESVRRRLAMHLIKMARPAAPAVKLEPR